MGVASITFDATLQTVFMIMFFTTVGFTVSIPALLKGGKAVMLCLAISIVMIPLQNFLGGGVMALFGRDPLLGIGCGSNDYRPHQRLGFLTPNQVEKEFCDATVG